jgi:hypothetical protein
MQAKMIEILEAVKGGVNEGSNGDKMILKHCKHKNNLRQHNN